MRISDWSSDVCSSDLARPQGALDLRPHRAEARAGLTPVAADRPLRNCLASAGVRPAGYLSHRRSQHMSPVTQPRTAAAPRMRGPTVLLAGLLGAGPVPRSEERGVGKEGVRTWTSRG